MPNNFDDPDFDGIDDGAVAIAPPEDQTPEFDLIEWEKEGRKLAETDHDVRWKLGDWIVKGTKALGDMPADPMNALDFAQVLTGLERSTLKDLASTARRVNASVRTDALSWSHHRVLINSLPDADDEDLKKWLATAIEDKLTVAGLAKALKSPVGPKPTLEKSFNVTVPLGVWEILKDFADDEGTTVQDYAAGILSGHCAQDEVVLERETAKQRTSERRHKQQQKAGRRLQRNYPGRHFGE